MNEKPSVEIPSGIAAHKVDASLSTHEQKVVDYALVAATSAARVQTEEMLSRTRAIVGSEIQRAFEGYARVSNVQRILMVAGGLVAFGLGWVIKGWVTGDEEDIEVTNGVHEV